MKPPSNGITPDVFRDGMPPYELSTDLLEAMFAAIPAPPPHTSMAWRETRAARLVQEVAGQMPADVPQARMAAAIVIVRETVDATFARSNGPGLPVAEVCRLQRTAGALGTYALALERTLRRHQLMPVPFFGTVLADGIDVAALAAGWGGPGSRLDGGEAPDAGGDVPPDGAGAGATPAASEPQSVQGESAPRHDPPTVMSDPVAEMQSGPAMTDAGGPDDTAESGGEGGAADGPEALAMGGSTYGPNAGGRATGSGAPPAMATDGAEAVEVDLATTEGSAPDDAATMGVVTRLDQGPGWTLDVVRPRVVLAVVGADEAIGEAPARDA